MIFAVHLFTFLSFLLNTPATTAIYTLSLHDALPICAARPERMCSSARSRPFECLAVRGHQKSRGECCPDRKSTRLNSSHRCISYAVFCLKKKIYQRMSL